MFKIYYNDKDRWDKFWKEIQNDPDEVNPRSYPIYPGVAHIDGRGKILENGCGLGRVVNYFHVHGYDIVGLEYNFYAIDQLKKRHPDRVVLQADAMRLPFAESSFDYIYMMGVVDTFMESADRHMVLKESLRVLRGNGKLFICVPNAESLFWLFYRLKRNLLIRRLFGMKPLPQYFGQYAFKKSELLTEVRAAGFDIIKIYYVQNRCAVHSMFPFFRKRERNNDSFLKRERSAGEEVYRLNILGRLFIFLTKHTVNRFIGPSLYFVAQKKDA